MPGSETPPARGSGDKPVPPERDIIREDNWPEYEARGFGPIHKDTLEEAQALLGAEHVYVGDAWDQETGRPRRDKPGIGFYASGETRDGFIAGWTAAKQQAYKSGWVRVSRVPRNLFDEPPEP